MKLTKELIHFLHELRYEELPEDVIERTKFLLLDYLGVALAGSRSDSSRPVYKMIQWQDAPGPCTVIGQNFRVLPGYAALANGTGAHSLELDDTHQPGSIHLGVVIFSSAIAASEACRKIDGKQFITSVVAGYEAAARLAIALQPQYHYAGWPLCRIIFFESRVFDHRNPFHQIPDLGRFELLLPVLVQGSSPVEQGDCRSKGH